jgi:hypothetical protein
MKTTELKGRDFVLRKRRSTALRRGDRTKDLVNGVAHLLPAAIFGDQ